MGWGTYVYRVGEFVNTLINGELVPRTIATREVKLDLAGMPVAYYTDESGFAFDETQIDEGSTFGLNWNAPPKV